MTEFYQLKTEEATRQSFVHAANCPLAHANQLSPDLEKSTKTFLLEIYYSVRVPIECYFLTCKSCGAKREYKK